MTERLFGTDGVRGLAGTELTAGIAHSLGRAAVSVLGRRDPGAPTFVVGRDPRASGEWLEDALVEGIRDAGGDVYIAGMVPTPAVAYLATALGASSGVVISASHNPPEYNGLKFSTSNGAPALPEITKQIEREIHLVQQKNERLVVYERSELIEEIDPKDRYLKE